MARHDKKAAIRVFAFLAAFADPCHMSVYAQDAPAARADALASLRIGDFARAASEMAIAANAGDPDAQFRLAALYQAGRGVPQDDVSAFKWTRAAAVQGHLEAQAQLGALYQMGRGVERDDKEARLWLTRAAERGSEQAAKLLVEFGREC